MADKFAEECPPGDTQEEGNSDEISDSVKQETMEMSVASRRDHWPWAEYYTATKSKQPRATHTTQRRATSNVRRSKHCQQSDGAQMHVQTTKLKNADEAAP